MKLPAELRRNLRLQLDRRLDVLHLPHNLSANLRRLFRYLHERLCAVLLAGTNARLGAGGRFPASSPLQHDSLTNRRSIRMTEGAVPILDKP